MAEAGEGSLSFAIVIVVPNDHIGVCAVYIEVVYAAEKNEKSNQTQGKDKYQNIKISRH